MKRAMKWIGLGLGGLLALVILLIGGLYMMGSSKVGGTVELPDEGVMAAAADSATLTRGHYLVDIHACADCHGENLAGQVFAEAPPFRVVASNLTAGAGGIGADYSDADWERAIRHGVGMQGRKLLIMPSKLYNRLSDDEVAAMITYLKTLPAVDNELPPSEVRPLGRIIAATGGLYTADTEVDHASAHLAAAPPMGPTEEYGRHRIETTCTYCHGADLHGGPPLGPEDPAAPDLFVVTAWTFEQFETAMRTGVTPSGHEMRVPMPWQAFSKMTDEELEAIYKVLQTLEPAGEAAPTAASE